MHRVTSPQEIPESAESKAFLKLTKAVRYLVTTRHLIRMGIGSLLTMAESLVVRLNCLGCCFDCRYANNKWDHCSLWNSIARVLCMLEVVSAVDYTDSLSVAV